MSLKAIVWALETAPVFSSAQKFVLVALANYANEDRHTYPQVSTICRVTHQSDATVRRCLTKLEEHGLITDTQKRYGPTQQVKVWEISGMTKDPHHASLQPPKTDKTRKAATKDQQPDSLTPKIPANSHKQPGKDQQPDSLPPVEDHRKTPGRLSPCIANQGTIEPATEAGAGAPVGKEEKKPKNPDVRPIIGPWCAEYATAHGWKYRFNGNIDGPAAVRLIKSGIAIEELISVARQAWANPTGFYSKQAATLAGFDSKLNEIRKELAAIRRPGGSIPGTGRAPKDTLNRGF